MVVVVVAVVVVAIVVVAIVVVIVVVVVAVVVLVVVVVVVVVVVACVSSFLKHHFRQSSRALVVSGSENHTCSCRHARLPSVGLAWRARMWRGMPHSFTCMQILIFGIIVVLGPAAVGGFEVAEQPIGGVFGCFHILIQEHCIVRRVWRLTHDGSMHCMH